MRWSKKYVLCTYRKNIQVIFTHFEEIGWVDVDDAEELCAERTWSETETQMVWMRSKEIYKQLKEESENERICSNVGEGGKSIS